MKTRRVTVPIAPLLAEPRAAAIQTSQYLGGWTLRIIEERGDWLRVRGDDEYEGWMHQGYLGSDDRVRKEQRMSLGCVVKAESGASQALPLGALFTEDLTLTEGDAVRVGHLPFHFPAEAQEIAGSALRLFEGTSYLWGGVTPWGADCSGFVQSIFRLHGFPLPRDAADQALKGVEIEASPEALEAGDLLFFSDGEDRRITHVAIALGDARIVHLALGRGGYAVETLRGEVDDYAAALRGRISCARRVIGSASD